ncbi:phosphoribosylanthranilate isomerase [Salinimicrobium sp. CDJ15-91]|uniref:N-(5'-phosphoribosyl)anthranilate isomerase n=2 Tax=Salinimicrobium oceani TaxID=2722702 RepID=A0ABX1CU63_9FLAO|nr:phosphoribosylanthranilate isomerase [Salinimicrobium oceani]
MREAENIAAISDLKPDYLGFIFYKGSARNVSEEENIATRSLIRTGVFVNAEVDEILQKLEKFDLAAIQLHGEETADFCKNLRKALSETEKSAELIKVFGVKEEFDFDILKGYEGLVDYFLFDTKGKNRGGNGTRFDWQVLEKYPSATPFFLSGGIGPDETAAIKKLYQSFQKRQKEDLFYGIDVNSKFEAAPGKKDPVALQKFKQELFKK